MKAAACQAAVMVRPLLSREVDAGEALSRVSGESRLTLNDSQTKRTYGPFDMVPNSTQELFEGIVQHGLLASVLSGFNATVLAYGQTGSGKTYAMGSGENPLASGLIQLATRDLFKRIPAGAKVSVTFVQIYCEEVHDLLAAQ